MRNPATFFGFEKVSHILNAAGFKKHIINNEVRTQYFWHINKVLEYPTLDELVDCLGEENLELDLFRKMPSVYIALSADFTNEEGWYFEFFIELPRLFNDGFRPGIREQCWSRGKIHPDFLKKCIDIAHSVIEMH